MAGRGDDETIILAPVSNQSAAELLTRPRDCGATVELRQWESRALNHSKSRMRSNQSIPLGEEAAEVRRVWRDAGCSTVCGVAVKNTVQCFALQYDVVLQGKGPFVTYGI